MAEQAILNLLPPFEDTFLRAVYCISNMIILNPSMYIPSVGALSLLFCYWTRFGCNTLLLYFGYVINPEA
ncbi:hypothetical protein HBI56_164080 [Parastagonospora nodorum]|nr:hypothetical protein HBH56_071860 [Parastagonospora nodorum]KAH3927238.1 hypothetical protein HBH54_152090 [Parastagonospora nodorum]KAH3952240.1 hypothetical protein HBH53_056270 [Parastagonospora nodorum]KAH3981823.1 hypothetical protein HBH51_038840 [Parastagonospora nodorum]KAH3983271.1 hypothetical protein HBH52_066450 [Parastagonospora nodorum]